MTSVRHDRTLRLLAAELEAVALADERSMARSCDFESRVLRLAVATRNAVVLGVISADEADRVWGTAIDRHPRIGSARSGAPLAA
jgi:hypothetical protein